MDPQNVRSVPLPASGVDEGSAYELPTPGTTPYARNIWPEQAEDGRARLTVRPAMAVLGGSPSPVGNFLARVRTAERGDLITWFDEFDSPVLRDHWSPVGSNPTPSIIDEQFAGLMAANGDAAQFAPLKLNPPLRWDEGATYTISARVDLVNHGGAGRVELATRLANDQTWPELAANTAGIMAQVYFLKSGSVAAYEVNIVVGDGAARDNYGPFSGNFAEGQESANFELTVTRQAGSERIGVRLNDRLLAIQSNARAATLPAASRLIGFAIRSADGLAQARRCSIDNFTFQRYPVFATAPTSGVAVLAHKSDGTFSARYGTSWSGTALADTNIRSTTGLVAAAERVGELVLANPNGPIASYRGLEVAVASNAATITVPNNASILDRDYALLYDTQGGAAAGYYEFTRAASGSNWILTLKGYPANAASAFGRASVLIQRPSKVFRANENKIYDYVADVGRGTVPLGATDVVLWQDRICMAVDNAVFCSRSGDHYDWLYGSDPDDPAQAFATGATTTGAVPDKVEALIATEDDYLYIGTSHQMFLIRGNPLLGARLETVSPSAGIVNRAAWCSSPEGDTYFMSHDGLQVIQRGSARAIPLSRETLPRRLRGVERVTATVNAVNVLMGYSLFHGLVMICARWLEGFTPKQECWAYDPKRRGFWPWDIADNDFISCILSNTSDIQPLAVPWFGTPSGVCSLIDPNGSDIGGSLPSAIVLGPYAVADGIETIVNHVRISLKHIGLTNSISWKAFAADTASACADAAKTGTSPFVTITVSEYPTDWEWMKMAGAWVAFRVEAANSRYTLDAVALDAEPNTVVRVKT